MIEAVNIVGRQWAGLFGVAVLQNTVFLAVVFFALYVFRNAPARLRYMIAAAGFIKLLAPPFIPSSLFESSATGLPPVPFLSSNIIFTATPPQPTPGSAAAGGMDTAGLLFLFWAGAAVLYLVVVAFASMRLARRLRAAEEIHTGELAEELETHGIKIMRSSHIALPITLGLLPRRIYVPDTWNRWPERCRIAAIKHEVAHIRRRDGLFKMAEILVRAIYFFHPLVWLLTRRLGEYREMACDDAATGNAHSSRLQYSRNLVEIAESIARNTLTCESASALLRREHELLNRITYQMKEGVMTRVSKKTTVILFTGLALLVLPLSWYQSDAAPDDTHAKTETKLPAGMRAIDVSLEGADKLVVDGSTVTLESSGAALDKAAKDDPEHCLINMICANDVPMGLVFDVQRTLQNKNLLKVRYNSDLPEAMPLVLPSKHLEDRVKSIPQQDIAIVSVQGSGTMTFQNIEVSAADLPGRVNKSVKDNEHLIVSIEMERSATYGDFVKTLKAVKDGNAQRILIKSPAR